MRIFSSHGESRNNLFYHELSNIFHTDCRGVSRIFFVPIFFFVPNFRIVSSHGESRRLRIFFVPRLVLGATDQREVICELFLHTECRGWLWGLLFMRMGGYSSLSIGQYGESVSDDHRSGWNCCLASPEIFPGKSPPISMCSELPDVMIR